MDRPATEQKKRSNVAKQTNNLMAQGSMGQGLHALNQSTGQLPQKSDRPRLSEPVVNAEKTNI